MAKTNHVTLAKIYRELQAVRRDLHKVERALIPVEPLTKEEIAAHKDALKEALKGQRIHHRDL